MLRSIAAFFNNNFGSNVTHVANAYSTSEYEWIWIWFHTASLQASTILSTISINEDTLNENNSNTVTNYQLIRLPYRKVHRQQRSAAWEYLTVFSHRRQLIVSNYVIEANVSFIVTKEGRVVCQKYGENVWIERNGTNHYPQEVLVQQIQMAISDRTSRSIGSERAARFGNQSLLGCQSTNDSQIEQYRNIEIQSLEATLEQLIELVPGVKNYAKQAKTKCKRNSIDMTVDESAAIYLYSMDTIFYSQLNSSLRSNNSDDRQKWFGFLKLLGSALEKLPSKNIRLWRGVRENIGSQFTGNHFDTRLSVTSCTTDLGVATCYLGDAGGTVFAIDAENAKGISAYSAFGDEQEFVLMSGTRLRIVHNPLTYQNLCIVQLEEIV